jgi:hypothetical protein
MATADLPKNPIADWEKVRNEWVNRITALVGQVENWAQEFGWSTRRIDKRLEDSQVGTYKAPALLFQKETTRVLLEPIARSAPGADGVVDLYLMPAYDDVASLYFSGGGWQLHYLFPGTPAVANLKETKAKPLSKDSFREVLEEMRRRAA